MATSGSDRGSKKVGMSGSDDGSSTKMGGGGGGTPSNTPKGPMLPKTPPVKTPPKAARPKASKGA